MVADDAGDRGLTGRARAFVGGQGDCGKGRGRVVVHVDTSLWPCVEGAWEARLVQVSRMATPYMKPWQAQ